MFMTMFIFDAQTRMGSKSMPTMCFARKPFLRDSRTRCFAASERPLASTDSPIFSMT